MNIHIHCKIVPFMDRMGLRYSVGVFIDGKLTEERIFNTAHEARIFKRAVENG